MSVPTLGTKALFLPNRKGTLKRDNNRRAKAHRMALQSVRGDVDTREPASMKFSRGQLVDMKKLQQEAARAEHVEKCNRKLVDKMMMIMQGLCGTIVSEQTFPDFNPGTLNYRIRQRELVRIDRDNLALMHRLETASSGYNKALVKPKYFQQPHMGLFPRSEQSVKSAGSKSRKRIRPGGPPTAPSCGSERRVPSPFRVGCGGDGGGRSDDGGLGWGASVASALTEPSSFPTTTLGKFHDASSPAPAWKNSGEWRESGADANASELRIDDPGDLGGGDGGGGGGGGVDGGSVHPATGLARTPNPPSISSRATCGSLSGQTSSKLRKCRRLARPTAAKPGATVFQGGVRIGDDYAIVIVTRATEGFGDNGTQGFRIKAYFPLSVSVYTLGVSAEHLPVFTAGSHTAVRRLFQTGDKSRGKWEGVLTCLELRPSNDVAGMRKSVESAKSAAGPTPAPSATATDTRSPAVAAPAPAVAGVPSGGMDGTEERVGGPSAGTAGAAAMTMPMAMGVEMVLVPPDDAPVLVVQRLVRGWLSRQQYQSLKRSVIVIQAAIRGWKYRVAKRKHEAATKIAAVSRGKRCRDRVKRERAARGIQKRTRSWLKKRNVEKERAAKQIQAAVKRRRKRLGRDMRHVVQREESSFLVEGSSPATTSLAKTPHGGVDGAPGQGRGYKQPRRSPKFTATPTGSIDSSSVGRQKALGGGGVDDDGIGCSVGIGGGERGAGERESKNTAHVRSGAGVEGSAGKSGSQVSRGGASRRDRGKGGASGTNNRSNGDNNSSGSSSSTNNNTNAKPAGGGDRNKGKVGGGAPIASGKMASTPPRNQRPKPPDPKDFARSPYRRPRGGWVRGSGGGGARGTPATNGKVPLRHAAADCLRPAAPPRPSGAPGSHRPNSDRSLASSGGAQSEGVSVTPPPLPKSARAAPEVAGAWPSGGAGTRTANAAAKAAAAKPTTNATGGTPNPGPAAGAVAVGKKKALAAPAPAPRAVGSDQKGLEPFSEIVSQEVGVNKDEPANTKNNGSSVAANRQQRSSSIPWVEEAATGKHYRPPPPTTATKETAGQVQALAGDDTTPRSTDRRPIVGSPDTGQTSNNITDKKHAREAAVADGGGNTDGKRKSQSSSDRNRRTSSVSWAEDIAEGNTNGVPSEPLPLELVGSAVDNNSAEATLRAGSSKGKDKRQDDNDRNRRTSSVSWAEDIVKGKGESARQQPTPQKRLADGTNKTELAQTGGSSNRHDDRNQNRRTSSVSWAEDIVEGKGGSARQPSPQELLAVDNSKLDAASSAGNSKVQEDSDQNRRTSVSWAEDIIEGKGGSTQPHPSVRDGMEAAVDNNKTEAAQTGGSSKGQDDTDRNRRTSSISWAEEIVEGKGGGTPQKLPSQPRVESVVDNTSGGNSTAQDNSDQHRRTSSVSWAEDIVAEKEDGTRQRLSPQENTESAIDNNRGEAASSGGSSSEQDNRDQNRRTSSVSWAEEIVAEKENSGAIS